MPAEREPPKRKKTGPAQKPREEEKTTRKMSEAEECIRQNKIAMAKALKATFEKRFQDFLCWKLNFHRCI